MLEASRRARPSSSVPFVLGSMCLMPAFVREVAVDPVGVDVPEDSGVMGAGAMMGGGRDVLSFVGKERSVESVNAEFL